MSCRKSIVLPTSLLLICVHAATAQHNFRGTIFSSHDSTAIPYAVIKLLDTGTITTANQAGDFNFLVPENITELHIEVSAIGVKDTVVFYFKNSSIAKIYVERNAFDLDNTSVLAPTAKEIVLKAISLIPVNYADSSFASFSFYRQYEKVNGVFKNLVEAQAVVLSKISLSKNRLNATNTFDVQHMRRSDFKYDIEDFNYLDNEFDALLNQDPVYHPEAGSLNPNASNYYTFSFDTASKSGDYVIHYVCKDFSSEPHGVENIDELDWKGESWESGTLVIDPQSFAFKKTERYAARNKNFNYPKYNNFLLPGRHYTMVFVDAKLVSEYEKLNGKWFPKKICREYTNEYYRTVTHTKEFTITEVNEWYADSVTHFLSQEFADKFFAVPSLSSLPYLYEQGAWNNPPPFYFYPKEKVYHDLEKQSSLESQFFKNGN